MGTLNPYIFKGWLYLSPQFPLRTEPSCTSGDSSNAHLTWHPCLSAPASLFLYQFSWDHFFINYFNLLGSFSGTQTKTSAVIFTAWSVHFSASKCTLFSLQSVLQLLGKWSPIIEIFCATSNHQVFCGKLVFIGIIIISSAANIDRYKGISHLQRKILS